MPVKPHEVPASRRDDPEMVVATHHRCPPDKRKDLLDPYTGEYDRARMTDEDDLILLDVFSQGQGFPTGVPFQVHEECPACHEWVHIWFVWTGPQFLQARGRG